MRETLACSLLEQLNISGLTWPEYAWIVLDLGYECAIKLEGPIVVKAREDCLTNTSPFYRKEVCYIKDLCKAFVLIVGRIKTMMPSLSEMSIIYNISIFQFLKKSEQELANYNPDTRQLSVLGLYYCRPSRQYRSYSFYRTSSLCYISLNCHIALLFIRYSDIYLVHLPLQ